MPIFSDSDIEYSYHNVDVHQQIHRLIAEHSTNQADIRDLAFASIDFSKVHRILDLGCAFGYSILGLKGKLQPGTHVVGFDLQETYQQPYLKACGEAGAIGEFHLSDVAQLANYPRDIFDLVIASFSMYFFPEVIPHIAATLKQDGTFVAITHSTDVLQELLEHIPEAMEHLGMKIPEVFCVQRLFAAFSCENGRQRLQPHFHSIQNRVFENRLRFRRQDLDALSSYVEMKKHLFFKETYEQVPDSVSCVINRVMAAIAAQAAEKDRVELNKNDCVFLCKNPVSAGDTKDANCRLSPQYCSSCGKAVSKKEIEGRVRAYCAACGYIAYENPLPVAATVVCNDLGEVLLVKRANHPMRGMWCLPCGFAESDEVIEEAALRELEEETGLKGTDCTLLDVANSRNFFYGNLLMVTYSVGKVIGQLQAGDDAMEAHFFPLSGLPVLAFPSHARALEKFTKQQSGQTGR